MADFTAAIFVKIQDIDVLRLNQRIFGPLDTCEVTDFKIYVSGI